MLRGLRRAVRDPGHTGLLVLLMMLAAAAFVLGTLSYQATVTQAQQIEDGYTLLVTRKSTAIPSADGYTQDELQAVVLNAEHVASENLGRLLVGVTEDTPVSIRTLEPGSPSALYDDERSIVMVEVICEDSWLLETPLGQMQHEGQTVQSVTMLDMANVRIENVLAAHPAYRDMPETLTVYSFLATPDGTSLFAPGEHYVLIARYDPPQFTSYGRDIVEQSPGSLSISSAWLGNSLTVLHIREDGKALAASDGTDNIAVLDPEDERIPALLAWVQRCNSSLPVFGVDDLDHLVFFHEGVAALTQGRTFSDAEVAAGGTVCVVSETYAATNSLSIGDTICLDLYRAPFVGDDQVRASYTLDRDSPCVQQLTATIIGLYDMNWKDGETNRYGFNINTIFVPRLALCEDGDAYSTFSNLGLTGEQIMDETHLRGSLPLTLETISLQPGQQTAYMADLAAHNLDDDYTIYDGGYSRIEAALNAIRRDGAALAMLCMALWLTLTLIALTTCVLRLRGECRVIRLLGTPRRTVLLYALGTMLPVALLSTMLGAGLGYALCSTVLDMLRQSNISAGGAFSVQISLDALVLVPDSTALIGAVVCAGLMITALTVVFSILALPGKQLIRKGAE
ncbi:MAG: ABC transporter permease [Clostridia bacterium]|nr:ABC transporter permease [Clostridia bacterium]